MIRIVLIFCALGMASCVLCSCKGKSTFTTTVGEHPIEIIKTRSHLSSGVGHFSREGTEFTYEYLDLKVELKDGVLTVNGKRYTIPNKDDFIRVVDSRVEINGQPAKPDN